MNSATIAVLVITHYPVLLAEDNGSEQADPVLSLYRYRCIISMQMATFRTARHKCLTWKARYKLIIHSWQSTCSYVVASYTILPGTENATVLIISVSLCQEPCRLLGLAKEA